MFSLANIKLVIVTNSFSKVSVCILNISKSSYVIPRLSSALATPFIFNTLSIAFSLIYYLNSSICGDYRLGFVEGNGKNDGEDGGLLLSFGSAAV